MCTQTEAISIMHEVAHLCEQQYKLEQVYLYGFYARGDFHEDSDVDIFIAVDINESEERQIRNRVSMIASEMSLKHEVTVSILVQRLAQFKKFEKIVPLYRNILQEGIRYV